MLAKRVTFQFTALFDNPYLLPLRGAEWVGLTVLLLGIVAGSSVIQRAPPGRQWWPPRLVGFAALWTMAIGVWVGTGVQVVAGAVLLAGGCCLSLWSVLLRLGVSWRRHVRPAVVPLLVAACFSLLVWYFPRPAAVGLLLLFLWARAQRRAALARIDRRLDQLLTRILVLSHVETASYLVELWFERFRAEADDLLLLTSAKRSRERLTLLPRTRSIAILTYSLELLTGLAEQAVDKRLRTDRAAATPGSWIRVLTRDFSRRAVQSSGIVPLVRLLSALVLAIPPAAENVSLEPSKEEGPAEPRPHPDQYVRRLISSLPPDPDRADIAHACRQVREEAAGAGTEWLTAVAAQAERIAQEPGHSIGYGVELLAEALWALYDPTLGPRPEQFDLHDQLRAQLPELLDNLYVRKLQIDEERQLLILDFEGVPKTFHELSSLVPGGRPRTGTVLQTRDHRRWSFRSLEASSDRDVQLSFRRAEQDG